MAGKMNQGYENAVTSGMEKYRYAMAYIREIFRKHAIGSEDVIVLLASEDDMVNRDTIRFLAAYRKRNRTPHFILMSSSESAEKDAENYAKVPYSFVKCSRESSEALERLYNLGQMEQYMIVNSFRFSGDHDMFLLADGENVTKADIVARVVLGLEGVPPEEERLEDIDESALGMSYLSLLELWQEIPHIPAGIRQVDDIVGQALSSLVCKNKISRKDRIVFFGVTKTAQSAQEQLKGYHIEAYLDNDSGKWGRTVNGIPVLNPEEISNRKEENADLKILVCSRRYREIVPQLMELGYKRKEQIFILYSERLGSDFSEATEKYMLENRIPEGKRIYEEIRRDYPEECILVRPEPGTGDVYLLGGYIGHIRQKFGKEKCVLIVSRSSEKKMAELFGMHALVYPSEEAWKLLSFARMAGFERLNIFSDNCNIDQKRTMGIEGYKNIDMHTLFQKMVFERSTKVAHFHFYQENSDALFEGYGLKKGRTALLAPYPGAFPPLPMERWEQLARLLIEKGYSVCTNIAGAEEKAVEGTVALHVPYSKIKDFMDKAGCFIGIRSGLCEIVSASSAMMAVFYPSDLGGEGFCHRFFGLEKMELRRDKLLELEYSADITEGQIAEVIEFCEMDNREGLDDKGR